MQNGLVKIGDGFFKPAFVMPDATAIDTRLDKARIEAAVFAAWMLGRSTVTQPLAGAPGPPGRMTITPLTTDPGYAGEPTFSPDGQTIAYVSNRTGNFEIFRKQISGGAEINLTNNTADDAQPAFSPDGSQIAFVSTRESSLQLIYRHASFPLLGGDIWVMPALSGSARRLLLRQALSAQRDGSAQY